MTTNTTTEAIDVIDVLADVAAGGALDTLRRRRPVTREQLQASNDALFAPLDDRDFPLDERYLVAAFATRLTGADATADRYAALARTVSPVRAAVVLSEADAAATSGPFGRYAETGLRAESAEGRRYAPTAQVSAEIGIRIAAAIAHAHLLVSRPRESSDDALDLLLDAGWSVDGIVTLSQLVAFLAFQQRVAAGLRVLAASADPTAPATADTDTDTDTDTEEATA